MDEEKHGQWLANRKRTFIAFCIICFGLGFEYSLIFPSLYYYLSKVIKTTEPELYYGIALSAYPVSSIIGAFTIARYADHSKRTRLVLLVLFSFEVVGNLLYSLYYSPLFPVFGRLIAGLGDVANMIMVGEVSRSYDTNEITSKISWMAMCYSIGFIIGPGMNILFKLFDFYIGPVHMVYANVPGLFMAVCFTFVVCLVLFMVSDISNEFDLKAMNEARRKCNETKGVGECKEQTSVDVYDNGDDDGGKTNKDNENLYSEDESTLLLNENNDNRETKMKKKKKKKKKKRRFYLLRSILSSFDLVLLLAFGFVSSYAYFGFDTMLPLIASKYFQFGVSRTSIIFIIGGLLYFFLMITIGKISAKYSDYHIMIFAVCLQLLSFVATLCLSLYHSNVYFNYTCLVAYILGMALTPSIEEVMSKSLFGKLIPSACQSYAEGVRRSVSNVAFIIAGVSTAGLFHFLPIIVPVLIVTTLVLLAVFVHRKESLTSPHPQFYMDSDEEEKIELLK